jgi:hypothetical protein
VREGQARDHRHAQAGRRERLDGHVVVGGQGHARVGPSGPAGVPDDAEPRAGRAAADPGLAGQVSDGDAVTAARQPVTAREHGLEDVIEQVDAVVVARADLGKCLAAAALTRLLLPRRAAAQRPIMTEEPAGELSAGASKQAK